MPVLHLIAGPNGAGKSTLYRYLIQPRHPQLPFVNADLYEAERDARLQAGHSFVSETVFSHPSKLQLIADAKHRGFDVALYVVCLDEPRRLLDRVQQRVLEGGHGVPAQKVLERYPRTLDNLRHAVREVPLAMLFDAADTEAGGPHLVASVVAGQVRPYGPWLPAWARKVLGPGGAELNPASAPRSRQR